jgi:carbon-monoxide dehydrogenase medium subunit
MASFDLAEPETLDEALELLGPGDAAIRPIGGGTALMLMLKAQALRPARLVSLRRLSQLAGFSRIDGGARFRIGAMTTFAELEHAPEIKAHLPSVAATMKTLANVRVRNVATVGGNLAHGDPHLDLPPVWMALEAEAVLARRGGQRIVPVADIFAGYYETTIRDGELITEIRVPVRPAWRTTYVKVTTRAVHDWPALGLTISAAAEGRRITDVRIVLSAAVDRPLRLAAAEAVLRGGSVDAALLRRAGDAAASETETEIDSDSRGSADYKRHLLRIHLARAVLTLTGGEG